MMENRLWNKKTRESTPYVPGEQPKTRLIKLNTNENPYPPSPKVRELLACFPEEALRLYPDPSSSLLKETVADYFGIQTDQLFFGNGSDEVLALAFQSFFDADRPVAFPDITYSFYPVYAGYYGIPATQIPLEEDYTVCLDKFKQFEGAVVLSNPNAPTGVAIGVDEIRGLLLCNRDRLVLIDEAYIDFGGESAVRLIDEFDNLLVVQTVSKSRSLAGLRAGYAMGNRSLIKALECTRDSFNSYTMDRLAQSITRAAFEDGLWFEQTRAAVIRTREWVTHELARLGFCTLPSKANFIFTTNPSFPAGRLYELLREQGILVRYFNKPRIDNHLRISIGTDEEMHKLVQALEIILSKGAAKK
jgi:histidinol-phosphate aminotransferase